MNIISNCALCEEHALHVIENDGAKLMQCLYCGYASSEKLMNNSDEYNSLTDEMKRWSKEKKGRKWIPGILTLPDGMIFPKRIDNLVNHKSEMKWAYARMIDIPEEEQSNYPAEDGKFYEKRYDTENSDIYDNFYDCMKLLNEEAKEKRLKETKIKLPKLKKINAS